MNILSENVSKRVVILSISIVVIVVLSLSTTYSLIYNTKKFSSNAYSTGVLDIAYTEGDSLELNNYIPMNDESGILSEPYTITITNTGTLTYRFDLSILSTVVDVVNIIDPNYIRLQIDDNEVVSLSDLANGLIYSDLILAPSESINIDIKMWLGEDTPNSEIGHVYSAKLVANGVAIHSSSLIDTTSVPYQVLAKLGLSDYVGEGIIIGTSDFKDIYYFTGDIDYNYVYFNGSYYRIIMIDYNGNMKMIYAGDEAMPNNYDDSLEKKMVIGVSIFNNNYDNVMYSGYTYLDSSLIEVDSNIKIMLDNWYQETILNTEYNDYVVDSVYCGNKRISNGVNFEAYDRIITNNSYDLNCNLADSYTVSNDLGNGNLDYPVGLISADELLMVGDEYLANNVSFWTMTSSNVVLGNVYNFSYNDKFTSSRVDEELGVRPVITIKTDELSGSGKIDDPFVIAK